MLPDAENRKLPPSLAYPFIATSFLLLIAILIRLSHRVRGHVLTWLTLVLAAGEIGLSIALFLWLKRTRSGPGHSS